MNRRTFLAVIIIATLIPIGLILRELIDDYIYSDLPPLVMAMIIIAVLVAIYAPLLRFMSKRGWL